LFHQLVRLERLTDDEFRGGGGIMGEGCLVSTQTDLVDAVRDVLRSSTEPMTVARIRERLPAPFQALRIEELADAVRRQVAAQVLVMCPKYRSGQDRFWDRTLHQHAKVVLREALRSGPMAWADLRKKFPKYLRHLADTVLNEELARGTIFRHPTTSARMGPRYGLEPADVRTYAAAALQALLSRLERCGFDHAESRAALLQLLQEAEWAPELNHQPIL
jgi:hypothetical protein